MNNQLVWMAVLLLAFVFLGVVVCNVLPLGMAQQDNSPPQGTSEADGLTYSERIQRSLGGEGDFQWMLRAGMAVSFTEFEILYHYSIADEGACLISMKMFRDGVESPQVPLPTYSLRFLRQIGSNSDDAKTLLVPRWRDDSQHYPMRPTRIAKEALLLAAGHQLTLPEDNPSVRFVEVNFTFADGSTIEFQLSLHSEISFLLLVSDVARRTQAWHDPAVDFFSEWPELLLCTGN